MKGRLLLNVVVGQGAAVFELFAGEDQALLVRRNALLVLDLGFDVVDGIGGLDLESDGLAGDCRRVGSVCWRSWWREWERVSTGGATYVS
jgi:hypothetical protein